MLKLAAALILLHGLDGRQISINPDAITSMHASIPNQTNKNFPATANCMINLSDGKFITVMEKCEDIKLLLGRNQ